MSIENQLLIGSRDVQEGGLVGEELALLLKINSDLVLKIAPTLTVRIIYTRNKSTGFIADVA